MKEEEIIKLGNKFRIEFGEKMKHHMSENDWDNIFNFFLSYIQERDKQNKNEKL